MQDPSANKEIITHLFRQEYAKMTAILCRHFGLKHLETAEDIVSDTFLKASEHWAIHGIPEKPTAWLYTIAKNKTKDYFKHVAVFDNKVKPQIAASKIPNESNIELSEKLFADSQLAMIFAVCNPLNSQESQICLALQILCGFSVHEIANAFMTKIETIKKRLQRARNNLRNNKFDIQCHLSENIVQIRLDTVLKTLYLLFNEGYFSRSQSKQTRIELCTEATRLTLFLAESPLTSLPQVNALLALMCFQSSRIQARSNTLGETILFEEQDRDLWDLSLIERGNYYLVKATNQLIGCQTKYHLEAAIAYWHTSSASKDKWQHILRLYDRLVLIEESPVVELNRIFAFAKVYGDKKAITEIESLNEMNTSSYHELLGYLYANIDREKSILHYEKAILLTISIPEKQTLRKEIERLKMFLDLLIICYFLIM